MTGINRSNPYVEYGTGFVSVGDSHLTWDNATMTLTLVQDAAYEVSVDGVAVPVVGNKTLVITGLGAVGNHVRVSLDIDTVAGTVALIETSSSEALNVAGLYLSELGPPKVVYVSDHRKSSGSPYTLEHSLNSFGRLKIKAGGIVTGYTLDSDAQVDVELGFTTEVGLPPYIDIYNGSKGQRISQGAVAWAWEQDLTDAAAMPRWKRTGATEDAPIWVRDIQATVPFLNAGVGRVQYDRWNAGAYSLQEATDGYYLVHFLLATNNPNEPIISVCTTDEYATFEEAREVEFTDILASRWGAFPFTRMGLLAKTILRTDNLYVAVGGYKAVWKEIIDCRQTGVSSYAYIPNVKSLAGRLDNEALPQYALRSPTAVIYTGGGTYDIGDDDGGKVFILATASGTFNLPVTPRDGYTISLGLMGAAIVLTIDRNATNTISFPNGMTAADEIYAGDSGSFISLRFIDASNTWAMVEGAGRWTGKLAAAVVSRYIFTGNVASGVEDNLVSIDAYGNIQDSGLQTFGGFIVSTATYTLASNITDLYVSRSATGVCTITIPSAIIAQIGRLIRIKDSGDNCSVFNITIATQGAETIEGEANAIMDIDGMDLVLGSDGVNLFVM